MGKYYNANMKDKKIIILGASVVLFLGLIFGLKNGWSKENQELKQTKKVGDREITKTLKVKEESTPQKQDFVVTVKDGLMTIQSKEAKIEDLMEVVSQKSGVKISIDPSLRGKRVSVAVENIKFEDGLKNIFKSALITNSAIIYRRNSDSGKSEFWVIDEIYLKEEGNQSAHLYSNEKANFELQLPKEVQIKEMKNNVKIDLPIVPNTNLRDKYLQIITKQLFPVKYTSSEGCFNPLETIIEKTETIRINNNEFIKEKGADHGMGHIYDNVSYSIIQGDQCIQLGFVLHSINPGHYDIPPKLFDEKSESEIFERIISSFKFHEKGKR